ncbi:MAG: sodium-translocating pyrophosphatase [Elusimicrobia bacterium]|nr:sodium-translocating pyrophosphatase [Elusimicrobiota bacterium]
MESKIILPPFGNLEWNILWGVLASALFAIGYGAHLVRRVLAVPVNNEKMLEVAKAIEEGAYAYLAQQIRTMGFFVVAAAALLYAVYIPVFGQKLAWGVSIAFLMGVVASYGAGAIGMWLAVKGNVRSAFGALTGFKQSMDVSFEAGTVAGMFTVGFGLLGATIIFMIFKEEAMKVLVGFGFGGALAALFMRMGGGIYTKAADVGADLVGKVEAGIPEDDPRNAATIADNVGDNVGDCAGMVADVFESYEVTLVAAIILAAGCLADSAFINQYGAGATGFAMKLILFALLIRALGVFASILGTWFVKVKDGATVDPMKPIERGYLVSSLASVIGFFGINYFYLSDPVTGAIDWRFALSTTIGVLLSVTTLFVTNYFTHPAKRPTSETAFSSKTGPATVILTGLASGLESSVWSVLVIGVTILSSLWIFPESTAMSAYGVSLVGLGLLTTTGFILAMDTYGPITDNAHGIFEMSGVKNEKADKTLAWMDAIGNTTKALTKGLAIATAVIAAVSLFRSFIEEAHLFETGIQVNLPDVFVGLLIGGAVPFLFCAFAIKAVGRAAYLVVEEVRRQFREKPGIMTFREKPDYARCVAIVTSAAQRELIAPAVLAIFSPIFVGFAFGTGALGGFLCGAILTGQLLAVFLSNAGAIWDNAKKKIEDGFMGGKGTDCHKAAVIGDTVGDPCKDTAGPALNPLIKVMNLVSIMIAPFVIANLSTAWRATIVIVAASVLLGAIWMSKKGSGFTVTEGPVPPSNGGSHHNNSKSVSEAKKLSLA